MIHGARIIPPNGGPHGSDDIRQRLGDSCGHREGDSLVVETIHFNVKLDVGDYQSSYVLAMAQVLALDTP